MLREWEKLENDFLNLMYLACFRGVEASGCEGLSSKNPILNGRKKGLSNGGFYMAVRRG